MIEEIIRCSRCPNARILMRPDIGDFELMAWYVELYEDLYDLGWHVEYENPICPECMTFAKYKNLLADLYEAERLARGDE